MTKSLLVEKINKARKPRVFKTLAGSPNDIVEVDPELPRYSGVTESFTTPLVMTFGEFNPPNKDNLSIIETLKEEAAQRNAPAVVFLSKKEGTISSPLKFHEKLYLMKESILDRNITVDKRPVKTLLEAVRLAAQTYKKLVLVVTEDIKTLASTVLKTEGLNLTEWEVITTKTVINESNSRKLALNNDFVQFSESMSDNLSKMTKMNIFNIIRKRTDVREDVDMLESVYDLAKTKDFRSIL